ncbi:MAG: ribose 5-phosphate isomerase B [Endomicrobium sp.]|jgi:ribose 5-phosphate isomerase B|nr:ribose 5-phosphate isomerase B [Endomicrobium sp.]
MGNIITHKIKKLAFGTDHTATKIRGKVKNYLQSSGYEIEDFGFNGDSSCDYPDFALKVSKAILTKRADKGILICGTGIGMSIAANKIKNVIAATCWDENTAKLAAQHNAADIICLGSRTTALDDICHRIEIFLRTQFEERHSQRIKKIKEIEKQY